MLHVILCNSFCSLFYLQVLKQVKECSEVAYIPQPPYPKPVSISGDTVDLSVPKKYQGSIALTTVAEVCNLVSKGHTAPVRK